jgi:hypothetical protein
MGQNHLADSNAAIDYLDNRLPPAGMVFMGEVVSATPNISVISQIEILRFNAPPHASKVLQEFVNYANRELKSPMAA